MKLRDPFQKHGLWFTPLEEKWLNLVRVWRNEERCRAQFHDSSVISYMQQTEWFTERYLPKVDTDAVWVFGDFEHSGGLGQAALYGADAETITFGRLMVDGLMLRRGYGERATRACVERAFELGFTRVDLDVKATNEGAARVYERCGFRETRRTDETIFMSIASAET